MSSGCGPGTACGGRRVAGFPGLNVLNKTPAHEAYVLVGWQDKTWVISRNGENANKTG